MKKNFLLDILLAVTFSQIEHPHPPLNLVSIPTAGTLPRGSYTMEMILQKEGGFLPRLAVGITDYFINSFYRSSFQQYVLFIFNYSTFYYRDFLRFKLIIMYHTTI